MFFITTFRVKPNLSAAEKGKLTRAFRALRVKPNNPVYQEEPGPKPLELPPWTRMYRTDDGAHWVIIINTDEGGPRADAGPGPDLEWLSDMKTRIIELVDFDETHRMERFDRF
jgi:hypothetical protein